MEVFDFRKRAEDATCVSAFPPDATQRCRPPIIEPASESATAHTRRIDPPNRGRAPPSYVGLECGRCQWRVMLQIHDTAGSIPALPRIKLLLASEVLL